MIEKLKKTWEQNSSCANCQNDSCSGNSYCYNDLCGNIAYLRNYGEDYYKKILSSFEPFLVNCKNESFSVFSFGSGPCLEYAIIFRDFPNFTYYPIDATVWPIRNSVDFCSLGMPSTLFPNNLNDFASGVQMISQVQSVPIICFFNSINDILHGCALADRQQKATELVNALQNKAMFYVIVNYTRSSRHYDMTRNEMRLQTKREREVEFIQCIINEAKKTFQPCYENNVSKEIQIFGWKKP